MNRLIVASSSAFDDGEVGLAGAMYDVTGKVTILDVHAP
jgi:hypothetical protein